MSQNKTPKADVVINNIDRLSEAGLDELVVMQGNLKSLSEKSFKKITVSLIENGFCSPFHIWIDPNGKKQLIDGAQRLRALQLMAKDGQQLPKKFPVLEIKAKDKKDAARKLAGLASSYGVMTYDSVSDFATDLGASQKSGFTAHLCEEFIICWTTISRKFRLSPSEVWPRISTARETLPGPSCVNHKGFCGEKYPLSQNPRFGNRLGVEK